MKTLKTFQKILTICVAFGFTASTYAVPDFKSEIIKYKIQLKGFTVGSVLMRTLKVQKNRFQIIARVSSFKAIKKVYFVQGSFGAIWNYKTKKSYLAWEDIYQGTSYQRRSYRFDAKRVFVSKHEKTFSEAGFPHNGPLKKNKKKDYYINETKYQDLLGVFYQLRSQPKPPKKGDVFKLPVLPAGTKKIMYIQILGRKTVNVPALGGKRRVFHVRTGLLNENQKMAGGDIFIVTQSPIDMYITDDMEYIPVLMWTTVPIVGKVYINLSEYIKKD